jgi:hypothetical protein
MMLASSTSSTGDVNSLPLIATGHPSWKRTDTVSAAMSTSSR